MYKVHCRFPKSFFNYRNLETPQFLISVVKLRDGAVVARWAHNPKVVSSSLAPATIRERASSTQPLWLNGGVPHIFFSFLNL